VVFGSRQRKGNRDVCVAHAGVTDLRSIVSFFGLESKNNIFYGSLPPGFLLFSS